MIPNCPFSQCGKFFDYKNQLLEHLKFEHRLSNHEISKVNFLVMKMQKIMAEANQDLDCINDQIKDELNRCNKMPRNPIHIAHLENEVAAATIGNNICKSNNPSNRRSIHTKFNQPLHRSIVKKAIVRYNPFPHIPATIEYNAEFVTSDDPYSGIDSESQSFLDTEACFEHRERIPQNAREIYSKLQTIDQQAADIAAHCDLHGCNCSSSREFNKSDINYDFQSISENFSMPSNGSIVDDAENGLRIRDSMESNLTERCEKSCETPHYPNDQFDAKITDSPRTTFMKSCSPQSNRNVEIVQNKSGALQKPKRKYYEMIIEAIQSTPGEGSEISKIYSYISTRYPFYSKLRKGWKNAVRHNLSLHSFFRRQKDPSAVRDQKGPKTEMLGDQVEAQKKPLM
ncbi:MAG: Forkhead box protein K2 [Marteilia pararefringens]